MQTPWTTQNNQQGQYKPQWTQNQPPPRYQHYLPPAPTPAAYNTESIKFGYIPPRRTYVQQQSWPASQSIRTDNRYQPLSEAAGGTPGRHIVGKHQASSPLENEQSKKHREESDESEGTLLSHSTINQPSSPARNTPMEQSEIIPDSTPLTPSVNTQQQTQTRETVNNTPDQSTSEIPLPSEQENLGTSQRDTSVDNNS